MQPDFPPEQDPQVIADEFAVAPTDMAPPSELMVPAGGGTPMYGVACVEGIPDGSAPRRQFAPGSLTFAPTPFSFKWQVAEDDGHDGSVVVGRVDAIWRDGALIRFMGVMDSLSPLGADAERMIAGQFVNGISILADDTDEDDIEEVYPTAPMATEAGPGEVLEIEPMMPELCIIHAARVRSLTLLPEPAFVECIVHLGESPLLPPAVIEGPTDTYAADRRAALEAAAAEAEAPITPTVVTAAAYTITIPEVWPEAWFQEPSAEDFALTAAGALHVTREGRVFGLLAPAGVTHRGFRPMGRQVTPPRNIDYSEFQNKGCLVASAAGEVMKIPAGSITFDCGHASPVDARRADPSWAAMHYENSCSIAARIRVGENRYGTWVAGALLHGISPDAVERMMACALSGDWQGGKLKGALLVPVEGFPKAVTAASVRVRDDAIVASAVPIVLADIDQGPDFGPLFDLIASAVGRGPDERWIEIEQKTGRTVEARWADVLTAAGR